MILHTDKIQDEFDRPVAGAQVYVYNIDGSLATLTVNGTTPLSQPVISDEFGIYSYYANTAYYNEDVWFGAKKRWRNANVAVGSPGADLALRADLATSAGASLVETTTASTGAVVRTVQNKLSERISVKDFGAVGDGVTNDSAAFVAAIAYLKSIALDSGWIIKASPKLFIPLGNYKMGTTTLDITHSLIIEGETCFNGLIARLKWTGDCEGIRIQASNTSGTSTVDGTPHFTGQDTIIRNVALVGPYEDNPDFTGHTEGEYHAIRAKARYVVEDVFIDGWAGDGLHAVTSIGGGGAEEGSSNCSFVNRLRVTNVRNGVYIDGADANAGTFIGVIGTYCRQHTVWDSSFLGNTHIGHHSANAGLIKGVPSSQVSIGGNRYTVKMGSVGASTNSPPASVVTMTIASPGVVTWTAHGLVTDTAVCFTTTGALPTGFVAGTTYYVNSPTANTFQLAATAGGAAINTSGSQSGVHTASAGTDNAYWIWNGAGAVDTSRNIPLWVSGVSVREGGSYKCDSANGYNTWIGFYVEGGDAPPQFAHNTVSINGIVGGSRDIVTDANRYAGLKCELYSFKLIPRNDDSPLSNGQMWTNAVGDRIRARLGGASVNLLSDGAPIVSPSPTLGVGYATGAGGAVTQLTSRTTSTPQINKLCGQITLFSAAGSATWQTFTVPNTTVAATDNVRVNQASGTDKYMIHVTKIVAATSFDITFATTGGTTTEQPVFNFAVVKAVAA